MSEWLIGGHFRHLHFKTFFNDVNNTSRQGVLTPAMELWIFGNPRRLQVPTLGGVSCILTLASKWGCDMSHCRGVHDNNYLCLSCFNIFFLSSPFHYTFKIFQLPKNNEDGFHGFLKDLAFTKMWQCLRFDVSIYPKVSKKIIFFHRYFLCLCSKYGCLYMHLTFWHFNSRKNIVLYSK